MNVDESETEVEKVVKVKEKTITLTLNEEEAAMLFAVCTSIVGQASANNVRELMNPLFNKIDEAYPHFFSEKKTTTQFGEVVQKYYDNIVTRMEVGNDKNILS